MAARRRIIYVPGRNTKPEPAIHRRHLWRCILNGVCRVDARLAEEMEIECSGFTLAAWNYMYYAAHASLQADIPWIDKLIAKKAADNEDRVQARAWHRVATQLMYEVGDRFHGLIKWIPDERVKAMVRDTEPYFVNQDGVANNIRKPLNELICDAMDAGDRVLLIAHSMGSVIAYDVLWQLSHVDRSPCSIDLFLTIGSPLGMRYVQKHLLGSDGERGSYPSGIRRWENVSATGDLISLDKRVRDDFAQMIDDGLIETIHDHCGRVFNWFRNDDGLNVHRSYGYLVNPVVGRIVADWWREDMRSPVPVMVAHRGYPSMYPENTLIGFKKALEAGAGFVELDVQLTKDKIPVLYHDTDTMRISGVEGSLFDHPLAGVRELSAHIPSRFGKSFYGNPVMTLNEFSLLLEGWPGAQAFVEVKAESVEHFGLEKTVDRVIDAIRKVIDRCIVISFHHGCIEYAREQHGARVGWVLSKWNRPTEQRARELNPDFLFVSKRLLPNSVCAVWSGPWRWAVYVIDDTAEAASYPARGISYVETDRIGEMMSDVNNVRETSG